MIRGLTQGFRLARIVLAAVLLMNTAWSLGSDQTTPPGPILQLTIEGAIGPASADYFARAMDKASRLNAQLVVIRMDTPGGLDSAMRHIIKQITNSSVPVATYVSPTGARAASAGTYILYASPIAAMAPGTHLGAGSRQPGCRRLQRSAAPLL